MYCLCHIDNPQPLKYLSFHQDIVHHVNCQVMYLKIFHVNMLSIHSGILRLVSYEIISVMTNVSSHNQDFVPFMLRCNNKFNINH